MSQTEEGLRERLQAQFGGDLEIDESLLFEDEDDTNRG